MTDYDIRADVLNDHSASHQRQGQVANTTQMWGPIAWIQMHLIGAGARWDVDTTGAAIQACAMLIPCGYCKEHFGDVFSKVVSEASRLQDIISKKDLSLFKRAMELEPGSTMEPNIGLYLTWYAHDLVNQNLRKAMRPSFPAILAQYTVSDAINSRSYESKMAYLNLMFIPLVILSDNTPDYFQSTAERQRAGVWMVNCVLYAMNTRYNDGPIPASDMVDMARATESQLAATSFGLKAFLRQAYALMFRASHIPIGGQSLSITANSGGSDAIVSKAIDQHWVEEISPYISPNPKFNWRGHFYDLWKESASTLKLFRPNQQQARPLLV